MFDKLDQVEARYNELTILLADPKIATDPTAFVKINKELAELEPIVTSYLQYQKTQEEMENLNALLQDSDEQIRQMAQEESARLSEKLIRQEKDLQVLLLPKDPYDDKNILLEIRAGTGGEEAALFASVLLRMYTRYTERKNWNIEIMSMNETGIGGLKEVICLVRGKGAYSRFKYESGVHRVQRVPTTEAQGRIHTSAVTVAILPEAEDVDVQIDEKDLRIDVFRSSGPGGQSVNTTDSAVRVTYLPTGMVVSCQDEKSQHKNKAKAIKILKARLLDRARQEQQEKIAKDRRSQVGSGDRSERIRTYNFPQGRITDHRIGLTLYRLQDVLDGDLEEIMDKLGAYFQAEALQSRELGLDVGDKD